MNDVVGRRIAWRDGGMVRDGSEPKRMGAAIGRFEAGTEIRALMPSHCSKLV